MPGLHLLLILAAAGAGAQPSPAPPAGARAAVAFSGPAMGGRYGVRVVMSPADEAGHERVRAAIARELDLAARLFSGWSDASEVAQLNAHAATTPFPVSRELAAALALARRASELTGGAFDATVAPLVAAWGFGPASAEAPPPGDAELLALLARVGYQKLRLDPVRSTVTKAQADVACDLWALSGGWAADRIADALVALGHADVLVEVGGEVTARGRRADGGRWRVALEWPDAKQARARALVLELDSATVATAADDRKTRPGPDGRPLGHVIDPRSGRPVANGLASVSVVHKDGAWAGALATALLVLGPDAGRALAARERLAARFVRREAGGGYAEWGTPAFEALAAPAPRE